MTLHTFKCSLTDSNDDRLAHRLSPAVGREHRGVQGTWGCGHTYQLHVSQFIVVCI